MSPDFEAGIRAALEVIDGHGWLGVSHTVRVQLLGYTGPEAVEESELRAWRASPPTHPHPPSRPGAAGSSHK